MTPKSPTVNYRERKLAFCYESKKPDSLGLNGILVARRAGLEPAA